MLNSKVEQRYTVQLERDIVAVPVPVEGRRNPSSNDYRVWHKAQCVHPLPPSYRHQNNGRNKPSGYSRRGISWFLMLMYVFW